MVSMNLSYSTPLLILKWIMYAGATSFRPWPFVSCSFSPVHTTSPAECYQLCWSISWSLFSPRVQSINYDLMTIRNLNCFFHSPPHWLCFCNNAKSEWWSVFNLSLALERWIALNKCWPWNGEQVNRDVSLILTGEGLAQGQGRVAWKNLIAI